jgi:methyl-accepting chemotaxis protein
MDEMTQQNAALVEEAAAAAESLEEQAQALAQAVSVFKVTNERFNSPVKPVSPKQDVAKRDASKPALANRSAVSAKEDTDDSWEEF